MTDEKQAAPLPAGAGTPQQAQPGEKVKGPYGDVEFPPPPHAVTGSPSLGPVNEAPEDQIATETSRFLREDFVPVWAATIEASRKKIEKLETADDQTLRRALALLWGPAMLKLNTAIEQLEVIRERITRIRIAGILPGDPREEDALRVNY